MGEKMKGFTLVELMVAALLAGVVLVIALPLILVGRKTDARTEKREAVSLAGEAIYEYVADEIKFAGRLYIGDLEGKRPEGENWKSITVSEKDADNGETYARLLYGAARELTAGGPADAGTPLYDLEYQEKTDLVLEAEAVGRNQLRLTVKLMDGEQALYEKTSLLSLLNLTLNAANQIEGYVGKSMTTAPKEDGEGTTEKALVLWYQNSRETVKPFEDGVLDGNPGDPVGPGPDQAAVSLANPQYVKIGETVQVQYLARAEKGKGIIKYDWTLQDNQSGDGSYYVEEPMAWNEASKTLSIKGLNVSPEDKKVKLTLVVTFEDGTTASDHCDVIVYEGYKPGEGPVSGFVIVPEGLEELYAKNPSYPAWIRVGEKKLFWLEAVDEKGDITPYSPKNWYCGYDDQVSYKGFNFIWNWTPVLLKADGESALDGIEKGKNSILSADGTGRNYVEMEALGMETESSSIHKNSRAVSFGGENRTAYKPNGKTGIQVSRTINIYDARAQWRYLTDTDGTDLIDIKEGQDQIQVLSTAKYVELNIGLDTKILLGDSVNRQYEPEIEPESVTWFLNGKEIYRNNDICRFGIKENVTGAAQLSVGKNHIRAEFKDTAGFSYREEMVVDVPSEVAYVKFKESQYTLVNINQAIDGVSSREIEYELYDKDGNVLYEGMDEDVVKNAYEARWVNVPDSVSDRPFKLTVAGNTAAVTAQQEGKGTLELRLTEKGSGREIIGEDEKPCICTIDVKSMELQMKLRYKNNAGTGEILSTSIESGKAIPVFSTTVNLLAGFDAELKLPAEIDANLTERQREILNKTDWKSVVWTKSGAGVLWGSAAGNNNIYNIGYSWGTGTEKFKATSKVDSNVNGEISIIVNEAPVNKVILENVRGTGNELVIGEGADRDNDRYNSITLKALVEGQNGKDCDKNVIWTILTGKELVDTNSVKLNIEVDSEDSYYFPVIRLKKDLTEKDAGKKIVVRATSASSGKHAEYEISLLPQFEITYPYSKNFTLIHVSDGDKNHVPGSRELEANREADWSLNLNSYLAFSSGTEKLKKVTVQTQNISSGQANIDVIAKDALTGQTDRRTVTVKYEKAEAQSGSGSGWSIHFSPNGVQYLEVGDSMTVQITSGIIINDKLSEVGDTESVDVKFERASNRRNGTASITAIEPGISTIYATWPLLWWDMKSFDYIKIIVCGLKLPEIYSVDISQKTFNMNSLLKSGDTEGILWESSNPNIAEISDSGIVTLLNPGRTTITVSGVASNGHKYMSKCDLTVTAAGWGDVTGVTNHWKQYGTAAADLMAGSPNYGSAKMVSAVTGSSRYPVYYLISSDSSGKEPEEILRTEGDVAIAVGEGTVSIVAGAADKISSALKANVYELKSISIDSTVSGGMLNFITEGKKELTLSAKFDWGSNTESSVPEEFRKYEWTVDEKSKEYVDITTNADGTCTVTAKGMGAAYITCRSLANPDIYETYVVIVSF